jgi:hypothetical protein
MSISVSVPSCCRRRSSALNVTASPFRSNDWDRRRPPCRQRTRHRTAPFFRIRRSISMPTPWLLFVAFKDATASRCSQSPALQVHPRTAPPHPRSTPWPRLPAPCPRDQRGGRVVGAVSEQKTQVRRGRRQAQVCNRITHFVTHFPTHLLPSSSPLRTRSSPAQSRSRRQQLIAGTPFELELAPVDSTYERDRATPRRPRRPPS